MKKKKSSGTKKSKTSKAGDGGFVPLKKSESKKVMRTVFNALNLSLKRLKKMRGDFPEGTTVDVAGKEVQLILHNLFDECADILGEKRFAYFIGTLKDNFVSLEDINNVKRTSEFLV